MRIRESGLLDRLDRWDRCEETKEKFVASYATNVLLRGGENFVRGCSSRSSARRTYARLSNYVLFDLTSRRISLGDGFPSKNNKITTSLVRASIFLESRTIRPSLPYFILTKDRFLLGTGSRSLLNVTTTMDRVACARTRCVFYKPTER